MAKQPSLLFLGAGKRVSLLNEYAVAAQSLNVELKFIAYEMDMMQPIGLVADIIEGLRWEDGGLYKHIMEVVSEHNVVQVIPCVDPAILIAEKINAMLNGETFVPNSIEICLNKVLFQDFCESKSLKVIPSALTGKFPVFAKPSTGSSSVGAIKINNQEELEKHQNEFGPLIVQELLTGAELTVDCFITRSGLRFASPRLRLATAAGEVTDTQLVQDEESERLALNFLQALNLKGAATVQIKMDDNGDKFLMECNPRYGGGAVCTFASGWHYPTLHCADIFGKQISPHLGRKLIRMKRYQKEVYYAISD